MRRVSVDVTARNLQLVSGMVALLMLSFALAGCGGTSSAASTTPPPQNTYPPVPPVAITWSPSTSPLPAPPAQVPPPIPSTDFPLTVSNPTAGVSLTSPINVVATATPKNPIFFMRVYVDQLAVYFTFDQHADFCRSRPAHHRGHGRRQSGIHFRHARQRDSYNAGSADRDLEYSKHAGMAVLLRNFPSRIRARRTDLRRRLGHGRLDNDSESGDSLYGR
jgi:hypothetical protein